MPSATKPRVLVVEDEEPIRELVALALTYDGHDVTKAGSGAAAASALSVHPFDLVVLDVMLPDGDGFEILDRIQASAAPTATLFLTARDDVADRVRALRSGADDYLVKPFDVDELVARVSAILRRSGRGADSDQQRVGDLVIDRARREASWKGGHIALTPTEFKLLDYLARHADRALSRQQILEAVWDYDFDGESNVVEMYVSYLRRKLGPDASRLVHTVRGYGYMLSEEAR